MEAHKLFESTQNNSATMLEDFFVYGSAPRVDSINQVVKLVRTAYPNHHVTEVDRSNVSLMSYAKAGKAVMKYDCEDEHLIATRDWEAVGEGIEKKLHPGRLHDQFRLVRFQYVWENKEYLVQYVTWVDAMKRPERRFYILYPRVEASLQDGHCEETDTLVLEVGKWTSQLHKEIFVFDDGYWDKSSELWHAVNSTSWDDVILDPEMKQTLIEDVQGFFDNQSVYKEFAVPWKRGVILHGVPGNGKTVSIKALMKSLNDRDESIPSLYVKSLKTNCQTEQFAVREIFKQARRSAPCLLIFEDLDSLVTDEIRSYFLNEVDGLDSNDGILMIGSTNHLDKLDPAIAKRPSRFDRKYHFKLPGEEERKLYAEYWRQKLVNNDTVEFPEELTGIVAKLTEGFSFAYLKELFVVALLSLVRGFKIEDFEIVDSSEAASAEDDKYATENAADAEKKAKDVCICVAKCSTCNKPLPNEHDSEKKAQNSALKSVSSARAQKMSMPSIEVPSNLSQNLLLKVVKHQIRILHSEMDNTKEESWPSSKRSMAEGGGKDYSRQMRTLARRRAAMLALR